ncbi:MAG: glycosyltransferase [Candidatus Paceibacterota bacterium]
MKILVLGRQHIAKSEDIIQGLQDLGHTVDYLLFPSLQYPKAHYNTNKGDIAKPIYKSKITYYWGHYSKIRNILISSQFDKDYDYILAIDWFEATIAISLRNYYPKAQIIYYAYDYYFYNNIFSSRYLINKIEQSAFMGADIVWAVNQQIIEEHKKRSYNRDKVVTVPLGIKSKDIPAYQPNPKKMLFIGNFKEGHNLRLLVNTFAQLPSEYHLHLIGQGNLHAEIESLIQDLGATNIILYGFKTEQESIDIIVQNQISYGIALYENTQEITCADPGKIKDYLALGLPVITTNNHSMSQDIQEYSLGLVLEDININLEKYIMSLNDQDIQAFQSNIEDYIQKHSYKYILNKSLN